MAPPDEDEDFEALMAEAEAEGMSPPLSPAEQAEGQAPPADIDLDVPLPPLPLIRAHTDRATGSNGAAQRASSSSSSAPLPAGQVMPSTYLPTLNPNQRKAVMHSPCGGLQILAGPGSGKTKVLTARVAYLVQHYELAPEDLVVVTFTNKAANEMKERLRLLVGGEVVQRLMMGTFHSVCVRYLRKYHKLVRLSANFVIADRADCLSTIKRCLARASLDPILTKEFKPNFISDFLSKCKSRGTTPEEFLAQSRAKIGKRGRDMDGGDWGGDEDKGGDRDEFKRVEALAGIFRDYKKQMQEDNALDFDDLLTYGLALVKKHPRVVVNVKHVLIDEFQDTNHVQYDLVKAMAGAQGALTIVGDPDQSIYGWRFAQVENLGSMLHDFRPVEQIFLEENYRSTGAILGAALAVVQQDTKRIQKSLKATHPTGSSVVLHCAPNAFEEAAFIAAQIKHLVAHTGGQIDHGDVAVLLRYGALSRNIEVALQKAGIPSRMVGGHKFFDRQEVKDVLSYLQLVENPSYTAAFVRIVNVPKRGVGEKTVREILLAAQQKGISAFEVCVKIANGSGIANCNVGVRKALRLFVQLIRDLRQLSDEGLAVPDLIDILCTRTEYRSHLDRTSDADARERWENVQELKAYAAVVADENPEGVVDFAVDSEEEEPIVVPNADDDDDIEESEVATVGGRPGLDDNGSEEEIILPMSSLPVATTTTPLRTFLAVSMLATDSETEDSKTDARARKVTLSTCHSAKGLEWPVVFCPAVEDGTYPFYRSSGDEEIDEERRLLYVAITRAQTFCVLTHSALRMVGAETKPKVLSPFLAGVALKYPTLFVKKLQKIGPTVRADIAKVLGREPLDEAFVASRIEEHNKTLPPEFESYEARSGSQSHPAGKFSSGRYSQGQGQGGFVLASRGPAPIPAGAGFTSALSGHRSTPAVQVTTAGFARAGDARPPPPREKAAPSGGQQRLSFARTVPAQDLAVPSAGESRLSEQRGPSPLPQANAAHSHGIISTSTTPLSPSTTSATPSAYLVPADPVLPSSYPQATSSTLDPLHSTASSSTAPSNSGGSLIMPETRSSRVNDVVLVNPTVRPRTDLLATFQSSASDALASMRTLGSPKGKHTLDVDVIDLISSDEPDAAPEVGSVSDGRLQGGGTKRPAIGRLKNAEAKHAKRT